jgi:hypothetical protein
MRNDRDAVRAKPGVLIINHEGSNRALFALAPAVEGYPIQLASDAEQGLRVLQQTTRECMVFMQLGPFRDMWDLLQQFHEDPQLHANHCVIVVDVWAHRELARRLEPDDMLLLPFTVNQMVDVLERNWTIMRRSKTS